MKARSGTPRPTKGFAAGGNMYSARQGDFTNLNVQKQVTNYNTRSASFQQMNNLVLMLDATYDELPDTAPPGSPSKAAWDTAAEPYAGMMVCGCKGEPMSGKKFFRLSNWQAGKAGLAPSLTPVSMPGDWTGSIEFAQWDKSGPMTNWDFQIGFSDGNGKGKLTLNTGKGLANDEIDLDGSNPQFWKEGTSEYDILTALPARTKISYCLWNLDGVPAGAGFFFYVISP